MEFPTIDDAITPAAELASEANNYDSTTLPPINGDVRPNWSDLIQAYDTEYARQSDAIKNDMQRCDTILFMDLH